MQAKNEILEELRMLSAVVTDISRETPYGVPVGYFDDFPAIMLSLTGMPRLEDEAAAGSPFFAKKNDKSPIFSVPEGYFEGFAQNLLDKIKAGGAKVLGDEAKVLGHPEGAKEELARLSPLLAEISRKVPYQAPEGYFEELSPVLPILAEVREKPLYSVPEGYFSGLAANILSKVSPAKENEPARVISMRRRSLWKYSAAAVVAGLIFTIGWLRLHTPTGSHSAQKVDVARNLVKVSDQDLQSFLDDQNGNSLSSAEPVNSTATLDITDSDVKSLLGDVPDGELKSYMEEHGGANDIATN